MTYKQVYTKILNHGNLIVSHTDDAKDKESFLFVLQQAKTDEIVSTLNLLYMDILSCLEVVNYHINGEIPSKIAAKEKREIDRQLASAMWYIIHNGWEHYRKWEQSDEFNQQARDFLALTLWRISSAWGAVLDGDIDSLAEHVRNEEIVSR